MSDEWFESHIIWSKQSDDLCEAHGIWSKQTAAKDQEVTLFMVDVRTLK